MKTFFDKTIPEPTKNEYARTEGQIIINLNEMRPDYTKATLAKGIIDMSVAFSAGYLARKIIVGKSENVLLKLSGVLVEMFIANKVYNNIDLIRLRTKNLFNRITKKG
jgi:hypothetical protein